MRLISIFYSLWSRFVMNFWRQEYYCTMLQSNKVSLVWYTMYKSLIIILHIFFLQIFIQKCMLSICCITLIQLSIETAWFFYWVVQFKLLRKGTSVLPDHIVRSLCFSTYTVSSLLHIKCKKFDWFSISEGYESKLWDLRKSHWSHFLFLMQFDQSDVFIFRHFYQQWIKVSCQKYLNHCFHWVSRISVCCDYFMWVLMNKFPH